VFSEIFCKILLRHAFRNVAFQLLVNELLLEILIVQFWTGRHKNRMYKSRCYQLFIQLCFSRSSYVAWRDRMISVLSKIWRGRKRYWYARFEVLTEVV